MIFRTYFQIVGEDKFFQKIDICNLQCLNPEGCAGRAPWHPLNAEKIGISSLAQVMGADM